MHAFGSNFTQGGVTKHKSKIKIMSNPSQTEILADGLRYKSKTTGSPFSPSMSLSSTTMSCFFCGKHRQRALLTLRRIIGKNQTVCAPSCKTVDETIADALTHPAWLVVLHPYLTTKICKVHHFKNALRRLFDRLLS